VVPDGFSGLEKQGNQLRTGLFPRPYWRAYSVPQTPYQMGRELATPSLRIPSQFSTFGPLALAVRGGPHFPWPFAFPSYCFRAEGIVCNTVFGGLVFSQTLPLWLTMMMMMMMSFVVIRAASIQL